MFRNRFRRVAPLILICTLLCCMAGISALALDDPYIIRLEGTKAATFQILRIKNQLDDVRFSDELLEMTTVKISNGSTDYYVGKASEIPEPVTPEIPLAPGGRVTIDISFHFSEDADNRFQGVPYQLLWTFLATSNGKTEIHLDGGNTLYSNFNINPGDTYGFSILIINDASESSGPGGPSTPGGPSEPDDPGDGSGDPDDPGESPGPPDDPGDDPDDPGTPGVPGGPGDGSGTDSGGSPGLKTGDYSQYITKDTTLPRLITSIVFLFCVICGFIYVIWKERRNQATSRIET